MNKPATIIREELIESIVRLINESGLPLFVVEPILKDLYLEVKEGARQQLERDKEQYQSSVIESRTEAVQDNGEETKEEK